MTLGNRIGQYRRKLGMTQEALAQSCGVTNQAVSKWESDACCPDIVLLPRLAEVFGVSIDALFGRAAADTARDLPWEDDGTLRVVLYVGHELINSHPAREKVEFCYEGPALNIHSECSVSCGEVGGNVSAGGDVSCDEVGGDVNAGGDVSCDEVNGNVQAGGDVSCDDVGGGVQAGRDVTCDEVNESVTAGGTVTCDHVEGSVTAGCVKLG